MSRFGLVLSYRGRMVFGYPFGFGTWLPEWLKDFICVVWNRVVCLFLKHEIVMMGTGERNVRCAYCGATIHVLVISEIHKE